MQYAWLFKLDLITNNHSHKLYKSQSKTQKLQPSNVYRIRGHWTTQKVQEQEMRYPIY